MRKIAVLCGLCLMVSCDWFSSREANTRKLVDKELSGIDWNDVDQYPLFTECDEVVAKTAQRECFENTLLKHLAMTLQDFEFVLNQDFEDTIYVDFLVDREGQLSVLEIQENEAVREQIPEFNGVISQSLNSLPKLEPALKRGIPVNAKFRIPLVLNTN